MVEYSIKRLLIEKILKDNIVELKYIDPRKIKKIREVRKKRPDVPSPSSLNSLAVVDEYIEYFLYNERGVSIQSIKNNIKITPDTIAF